jgi:hypothetical protein
MAETLREKRGDPASVARYIETMTADLAEMARRHGLDVLGYLLEMARLEAENVSAGSRPRKAD